MRTWTAQIGASLDPVARRSLIVEANDGIIATSGVVEGFAGAGATGTALVVAAVSTMAAGAIAIAGARYAEEAAERESQLAIVTEVQRLLDLSPEAERAELAARYESKGLSTPLAWQVADELSLNNALAAHVEAEYGLTTIKSLWSSVVVALAAGCAFALGALVPLLAVLLVADHWRATAIFVSSLLALTMTSIILSRFGHLSIQRVFVRTISVAVLAMTVSLVVGSLVGM